MVFEFSWSLRMKFFHSEWTLFSHFTPKGSFDQKGVLRISSEAGLVPGFARVLKISDLFVFRDKAGRGSLHSVFQWPGGGSAIGWRCRSPGAGPPVSPFRGGVGYPFCCLRTQLTRLAQPGISEC